jgi:hypothetical protein
MPTAIVSNVTMALLSTSEIFVSSGPSLFSSIITLLDNSESLEVK